MMGKGLFLSIADDRGLALDPRTKVLATLVVATIMLGSRNVGPLIVVKPLLVAAPFIMLALSRRLRAAIVYLTLYGAASAVAAIAGSCLSGIALFATLGMSGIVRQFAPGVAMGAWLVTTTSVSEFMAACDRMRMPQAIEIPLVVMLRYFPAIADDYRQIAAAMRMRGRKMIRNPISAIEGRLVPLLVSAVRGGEDLSASALVRGLGGPTARTNMSEAHMRARDWISVALLAAAAACAVATPLLYY